jgi:RNA polymerase sigma factor (sigma-70 family)
MSDASPNPLLRGVRAVIDARRAEGLSNGELLHAFVQCRDEAAFAALVRRHGPMVLRVCRRVLPNEADAEDAFQATFLALARRAATVREGDALAAWLRGAASRMALSVRRAALRRRAQGARAGGVPGGGPPPAEPGWAEVQALLEEEVARLPEKCRAAFTLCSLEGYGRAEAARLLGVPVGTLSSRLAQARQRLQRRLSRRGVSLPAVLAAAALTTPAGAVVPAALALRTARAGAALASGAGVESVCASAVAVALSKSGTRSILVSKFKITSAVLLTLAALAGGAALVASQASPPQPDKSGDAGARAKERPRPAEGAPVALDRHGDPLPPGAIARLGTLRFRHGSMVTGLAFAPDGKTIVSGSYDQTIRVWDAATGRERLRLSEPGMGPLTAISVSKDGRTLAATGYGPTILADLEAGKVTRPVFQPVEVHTCVALSPDGKTLAAGCQDAAGSFSVRLWDIATGKHLRQLQGHRGEVKRAAFSPDGKRLATGGADGALRVWDVATGEQALQLDGKRAVLALAFSGDGKTLAAGGGEDGSPRLWDASTGKLLHELGSELGSHYLDVTSLAFSPDGKVVASAGTSDMIYLWDVMTGKQLRRLWGYAEAVAFSPDGATLASGGSDSSIRLWEVATGKEREPAATGHRGGVRAVAVSADGRLVATGGGDRVVRLWDPATGEELRAIDATSTWFMGAMALSPNGKVVATDKGIWDRATGKLLRRFEEDNSTARPSGEKATAPGALAAPVRVVAQAAPVRVAGDEVTAVAFSPDGRAVATTFRQSGKHTVRIWDAATGKEIRGFGDEPVHALGYSPDGRTLAAGYEGGSVVLWDVAAGVPLQRIAGHKRAVNSVAFSPDGKSVASSSGDVFGGDVFLWETATGKKLRQFARENQVKVLAVTFAPSGKMLATAEQPFTSEGGASITLWEVATGQVRLRLAGHQGDVNALAFAADGRSLVSGSTDSTALVWDVTGPARLRLPARPGLEGLWADLREADAPKAYAAACTLAADPAGIEFLGERLPPVTPVGEGEVAGLLKALDSPRFAKREKAVRDLERLGAGAEPVLRKALAEDPSTEVRERVRQLLDGQAAGQLRRERAVEALELAGTPTARRLLRSLAEGVSDAHLTRAAKAALGRLAAREAVAAP